MAQQATSNENTNARTDGQKVGPVAPGKKRVTNLMSGREIDEDANTPFACSVASESYWCS